MKRILSALLSFTFTLASVPAAAEDRLDDRNDPIARAAQRDDVIADIVSQHIYADETHFEGTEVVAEFDARDEVNVAEVLSHLNNVTVAVGENDPVERVADPKKNVIVKARSLSDMPIFSEAKLRDLLDSKERVRASIAKHAKKRFELLAHRAEVHRREVAVLVSAFAGGTYGTYYFLLTSSWLRAGGTALEGFITYLGVSMFNRKWISFSRYGAGNATAVGAAFLTTMMGHVVAAGSASVAGAIINPPQLGPRGQVYFRRAGQLLTAYGLSVISTFVMMETAGQIRNPTDSLSTFSNALFGAHDTLDIKARQKFGEKISELISPLRIFACQILEAFAMGGNAYAEYTIVGAIGLFSVLFMFREWKWAKRRLIAHKEKAWTRFKETFASLGPSRFWTGKKKAKDLCLRELETPGSDDAA